jgi:uncharacterized protein YlxW (UPF0749 family)
METGRPWMPAAQPALLEAIVANALDPAYADASARRGSRRPRARSATAVLLLVGGLLVGVAVGRERTEAPAAEQARTALLGDARQRTAAVNDLSNQIGQLRRETAQLQASALTDSRAGRALTQQQDDLTTATAESAVTGPGLQVSVDDATGSGTPTGSAERRPDGTLVVGRVTDRDLQDVVNALWAAGAEAISVGGIRLSPTTSIRTAGETILADYRPLSAPYVLQVIGPSTLGDRFRAAGSGILGRLRGQGNLVRVTPQAALALPAATSADSGLARPLPSASTTTSGAHP